MPAQAEMTTQYSTSEKLAARARLHQNYTIAETPWFTWVARRLGLSDSERVLDIGCGPGWFWAGSADVLPDRLELTLADQSAGMVAEAVERCRAVKQWTVAGQQADAMALPFADESFDTVVAMHMLYHVGEPARAIAEMHRILRPGGVLAVTTNGAGNLRELYQLTTAFGGSPVEPVAAIFGFDAAERLLRGQFGNVVSAVQPARLRVTEPDDVFLALTSYPPGDGASEAQLGAFRTAIDEAFGRNGGVLEVGKESGLSISCKDG